MEQKTDGIKEEVQGKGSLPKQKFPGLLEKTLNALEEKNRNSMNTEGGFCGSGIYPLVREAVLKCLRRKDVNENIEESWMNASHTFGEKESRMLCASPTKIKNVPGERFDQKKTWILMTLVFLRALLVLL